MVNKYLYNLAKTIMLDDKKINFIEFNEIKKDILKDNKIIWDASETNLYGSLPHHYKDLFPKIEAETDAKWSYRCHLSEAFIDVFNKSISKNEVLVSHGVRDSLNILMSYKSKWLIPSDVYPEYLNISDKNKIDYKLYKSTSASTSYINKEALASISDGGYLLICDPLKPWQGVINYRHMEWLLDVAEKNKFTVVVDAAYDFSRINYFLKYIKNKKRLIVLTSLSKSWLIPGHAGFAVSGIFNDEDVCKFRSSECDRSKISIGASAMLNYSDRPDLVKNIINDLSKNAIAMARAQGVKVYGISGYFINTKHTFSELLNNGVLAIPNSVFGDSDDGCVISCLKPYR